MATPARMRLATSEDTTLPWVISLIVAAALVVFGGVGYMRRRRMRQSADVPSAGTGTPADTGPRPATSTDKQPGKLNTNEPVAASGSVPAIKRIDKESATFVMETGPAESGVDYDESSTAQMPSSLQPGDPVILNAASSRYSLVNLWSLLVPRENY